MAYYLHVMGRERLMRLWLGITSMLAVASLGLATAPARAQGSSTAAAAAIVIKGHARFTVLTPQLIRMEWSADGKFEDRPSLVFINRRMPVPAFTVVRESGTLTIKTSELRLDYNAGSGDGLFSPTDLTIQFTLDGRPVIWHPGIPDTGNLQGTTRTLDGANGNKTREPLDPGLISRDGWVVVDDSARNLFDSDDFRFANGESSPWPWVVPRPAGDRPDRYQDWYFFGYGHNYKQALGDFVQVAGRIPLPPRFAFGAWWSRYWSYSDQEFLSLVKDFKENDVPMDVLVIDMGWHPNFLSEENAKDQAGQRKGWTGYTWDKLLFPDPHAFLNQVHADGLKATLNLHPRSGVQPWEDAYPAMARAMDIDPSTQKYVPFDITNKKFSTNYMDLLHHPLEKQGVDFWWLDWQQEPATPIAGLSNTWWLNYVHFTDQQREGKRPLLFHRWGGLGNHRYQIGFSGDTISSWDSLAFQPWFTATAANVGYAYWSHDIGGHIPGVIDPELYARWVQFGAFSPILRTHTTSNPDAERRLWAYPEPYSDAMRNAFQMRYALQPYLYTEARRTYDTGVAFLRPLYYDWPNADEAYTSKAEYSFGDSMIVDPVVAPVDPTSKLATEKVWLPEGDWIEYFTGKRFTGPITLTRSFSIDQIPLYVRAGAVIPMMPKMQFTGEKPIDPLIVTVLPLKDGQSSSYSVYEDSGHAEDYQHGAFSRTPIEVKRSGDLEQITIEPVVGSFDGMLTRRGFEFRLAGDWPPDSISINANFLPAKPNWRFDGNTLTTIFAIPSRPVSEKITIRIRHSPQSSKHDSELDGFAGAMTRYIEASDAANHEGSRQFAPDELILLAQTGDRIGYHPETAPEELTKLPERYAAALQALNAMLQKPTSGSDADHAHRTLFLQRAIDLLNDSPPAPH
jgi:hypothetical protein